MKRCAWRVPLHTAENATQNDLMAQLDHSLKMLSALHHLSAKDKVVLRSVHKKSSSFGALKNVSCREVYILTRPLRP